MTLARPCRTTSTIFTTWRRFQVTQSGAQQLNINELRQLLPEQVYASSIVHGRGVYPPVYHPRTHNIPVAIVHFRSHEPSRLDMMSHFAAHAASALAIPVSRTVYLPTQRTLWTVPRGPFAHKKSQENFERRVHKRAIKAWDADDEVIHRWLKYLERHVVPGVGMRFTQWERLPLGVGELTLKNVRDQMALNKATPSQNVKALGEKIVQQETVAASQADQEDPTTSIKSK